MSMGLYDDDNADAAASEVYKAAQKSVEALGPEGASLDLLRAALKALQAALAEYSFLADTDAAFKGWQADCRRVGRELKAAGGDWDAFAKDFPDFVKSLDKKEGFQDVEVMNGRFGFVFPCPDDWTVKTDQNSYAAAAPDPDGRTNLNVMMKALPAVPPMEAFAAYSVDKLRSDVPGCNIVDRAFRKLHKVDAYQITFTFNEGDALIKGLQVFAMSGNTAYTVTFVAPSNEFDGHAGMAAEMIDSLEIRPD
jgi:hypothetical protein